MNIPLEIRVIEKFVTKDKQSRYIQFVSSKKARIKFIKDLPHFNHFKWELFENVKGNDFDIFSRIHLLKGNKTTCYIISENHDIDQQIMDISEALQYISEDRAIILVFGDAEMIYFGGEPPKNSFLSKIN